MRKARALAETHSRSTWIDATRISRGRLESSCSDTTAFPHPLQRKVGRCYPEASVWPDNAQNTECRRCSMIRPNRTHQRSPTLSRSIQMTAAPCRLVFAPREDPTFPIDRPSWTEGKQKCEVWGRHRALEDIPCPRSGHQWIDPAGERKLGLP